MDGDRYDNLLSVVMNLYKEASNPAELMKRFSVKMQSVSGVDSVIIKERSSDSKVGNFEEFIFNTRKPYVDNSLSDYSAFPELIEYYNKGYKSCMVLPISAYEKKFGLLILLSKQEEAFGGSAISDAVVMVEAVGNAALFLSEREKSVNLAKYFDAAFNSSSPQALIDKNGHVVKANKEYANLFDYSVKEALGKSFIGNFGVDEQSIKGLFSGIPITTRIPDGRLFVIRGNSVNDRLTHILIQNMTEFRNLEDIVELAQKSRSEIFISMDKDLKIKWVSSNAADILGLVPRDIIGANFADVVYNGAALKTSLASSANNNYSGSIRLSTGNGMNADVKAHIYKIEDSICCILSKEYERYFNELSSAFDQVVGISNDAVIKIDENGMITQVNKSFEKILKYTQEEIVGKPITSIYDGGSGQKLSSYISIAKKNGVVTDMFANMLAKNNDSAVPFRLSIKKINDGYGSNINFLIIGKELATKIRADELQDEIEKRLRELEKYKAESDLKTQFIYNISHDLKTPITNIKGFSKLLYKGEFGVLTEEQKGYLSIIMDELDRLMFLIGQILDVAKLNSGKVTLDLQQVNLNELLNNPSIKAFEEVCKGKGLYFNTKVDYDVPEIEADPNRLIQVLVNLIGNAVKFTEKGGIDVIVTRSSKTSKYVRIAVKDTGIGIAKDEKKKVFKKFFQVHRKDMKMQEGAGTGLGLSITKEIVNLHGGRVDLESEQGKGSEFWFTIPFVPKTKRKTKKQAPKEKIKE